MSRRCPECHYTFRYPYMMAQHFHHHLSRAAFCCPVCTFSADRLNVKMHMKRVHPTKTMGLDPVPNLKEESLKDKGLGGKRGNIKSPGVKLTAAGAATEMKQTTEKDEAPETDVTVESSEEMRPEEETGGRPEALAAARKVEEAAMALYEAQLWHTIAVVRYCQVQSRCEQL